MRHRCDNLYSHLPGKQYITYPKEWKIFDNFKNDMWDDFFFNASLDRIDNNLPYSKENCRWITKKDQSKNRRHHLLTPSGEKVLDLWCNAEYITPGLTYNAFRSRMSRGMPLKQALTQRVKGFIYPELVNDLPWIKCPA